MTREEALQHFKEQLDIFGGEHAEAIKVAIEALSEETSTIQEKHQLSEETSTNTPTKSTNISTKSTNISTDTSADRPRGEWIEETSWKYKKGGRNSDMKEILGTEWMTMIRQRCSECNKVTMVDGSILYKYCPHCGSEMRGDTK